MKPSASRSFSKSITSLSKDIVQLVRALNSYWCRSVVVDSLYSLVLEGFVVLDMRMAHRFPLSSFRSKMTLVILLTTVYGPPYRSAYFALK